ncbi:MAG: glycosyltransferase [Ignavibacteria bacterium]|nr:glycosyltransferase [Ignavibacteria bacterium]
MGSLSVCLIVKNEETYLEECLRSVQSVAGEIVLVDTGSTDHTLEIAERNGCRIFSFPWTNHFAEARNYALRQCTKEWILYLDADERLVPDSIPELRKILDSGGKRGIYCTLRSSDETGGRPNIMRYLRLFSNSPQIQFKGRVHEQIFDSLQENRYQIQDSEVEILHVGYDISLDKLQAKAERNLRLLLQDYNENKEGYTAFQIAQSYALLNQKEHAAAYFKKAVSTPGLLPPYLAHSYRYLAALELERRNLNLAGTFINLAYHNDPYAPLVNLIYAKILLIQGDKFRAKNFFLQAYKNNKEILSGKVSRTFDILVSEDDLLIEGLSLAVQHQIPELFDFLQRELKAFGKSGNKKELIQELLVYDKLFHNKPLNHYDIRQVVHAANEKNIGVFVSFISNYNEQTIKGDITNGLLEKFPENQDLLMARADILESRGDLHTAKEVLNYAYEIDPANITLVIRMVALMVKMNLIAEIAPLIQKAELDFSDNDTCYSMLQQLKTKLKPLYARS